MILKLVIPLLATIVIELGVLLFLRERRRRVLWGSVGFTVEPLRCLCRRGVDDGGCR